MAEIAKRSKNRGGFTTVGKTMQIAANRSLEYLKNRRFTFVKNHEPMADEQADAEDSRDEAMEGHAEPAGE